jgi:hypothetical protein
LPGHHDVHQHFVQVSVRRPKTNGDAQHSADHPGIPVVSGLGARAGGQLAARLPT